ncbi:MAG: hypothetical protein QXN63_05290 [Candidatus Bathyarchaeia archaeon]
MSVYKEIFAFALKIGLIALWMLFGTSIAIWLALYFRNIAFIFLPIAITIVVALYTEEKRKQTPKSQAQEKTTYAEYKPYVNALNEYEELVKKENGGKEEAD